MLFCCLIRNFHLISPAAFYYTLSDCPVPEFSFKPKHVKWEGNPECVILVRIAKHSKHPSKAITTLRCDKRWDERTTIRTITKYIIHAILLLLTFFMRSTEIYIKKQKEMPEWAT